MSRIREGQEKWIIKDRYRFIKTDFVLSLISFRFCFVPLKFLFH